MTRRRRRFIIVSARGMRVAVSSDNGRTLVLVRYHIDTKPFKFRSRSRAEKVLTRTTVPCKIVEVFG